MAILDLFYNRMQKTAQTPEDVSMPQEAPGDSMPMLNDQTSPNSEDEDRKKLFEAQIQLNKIQDAFNFVSKQPPGEIFQGERPYGGKSYGELTNVFSSELEEMMETVRILSGRGG